MDKQKVIIIGAGWAGLAAAIELADSGYDITIIESAKQTGGRARTIKYKNREVDNGQHIMIGAYQEVLRLMNKVGLDERLVLKRYPLSLRVKSFSGNYLSLASPRLPAPLHLLYALIFANGLSISERIRGAWLGIYMQLHGFQMKHDISVSELFKKTAQPNKVIRQLWEPLCLATMNTSIQASSANVFMKVFKDAFTQKRNYSDILLPTANLSDVFPLEAEQYLAERNIKIITQCRATKLIIENNSIKGIMAKQDQDENRFNAENIIIATAPQHLSNLLLPHPVLSPVTDKIEHFQYEPIITLYLQYPNNVKLEKPMIGLSETLTQWVFDRGILNQQHGLLSVIISSSGKHMSMNDEELIEVVKDELKLLLPPEAHLKEAFVIREKRATFKCSKNISFIRPKNTTMVKGLYLAGDYTDTGYPATLEGAVISGVSAASELQNS